MKTLTVEELCKILEEHKHWINKDCKNRENDSEWREPLVEVEE